MQKVVYVLFYNEKNRSYLINPSLTYNKQEFEKLWLEVKSLATREISSLNTGFGRKAYDLRIFTEAVHLLIDRHSFEYIIPVILEVK